MFHPNPDFTQLSDSHTNLAGTAKEISELSDIPRTRVYDAIRVLEAEGLVSVQHGNPRRFRAVSVVEATETLRLQYLDRIDTLQQSLSTLSKPVTKSDSEPAEVWTLNNRNAIESRTIELIDSADAEIVLVLADEAMLSHRLFERLESAQDRGVMVIVGGSSPSVIAKLSEEFPSIRVFESGLDWLTGPHIEGEAAVGRLLLTEIQGGIRQRFKEEAHSFRSGRNPTIHFTNHER
ncbi:TrmB family transcriptional regulator [Haladaptatus sp. ZSTT2]|uniref:TrmB family transcriptional regulator n=1 Tax=Haladaptatus sp. ZSTT2 TaxID=3120515 RepID=UPI00300EA4B5